MLVLILCLFVCCIFSNAQTNPTCRGGWTYFAKSNKCFKVFGGSSDASPSPPTTWSNANDYCRTFSEGHLASFHSDDEITFVIELTRNAAIPDDGVSAPMYVGHSYIGNVDYEWSDGSPFTYAKWWIHSPADADATARQYPRGILNTKRVWTGYMGLDTPNHNYAFACQMPPVKEG